LPALDELKKLPQAFPAMQEEATKALRAVDAHIRALMPLLVAPA
jgi:hypothetical protein